MAFLSSARRKKGFQGKKRLLRTTGLVGAARRGEEDAHQGQGSTQSHIQDNLQTGLRAELASPRTSNGRTEGQNGQKTGPEDASPAPEEPNLNPGPQRTWPEVSAMT